MATALALNVLIVSLLVHSLRYITDTPSLLVHLLRTRDTAEVLGALTLVFILLAVLFLAVAGSSCRRFD